MNGLRMTRKYRHLTFFSRRAFRFFCALTLDPLEKLAVKFGLVKSPQKTLLWTKHHTWNPVVPQPPLRPQLNTAYPSPSIELTDYDTAVRHPDDPQTHDTPAMAHSLFPPAIPTRRHRNSDPSLTPTPSHISARASDDVARPLIQRPSQAYHQAGDPEGRASSEGRVSFEGTLSPVSPPADRGGSWLDPSATVYTRQGYQRANSDPGSPAGDEGLGIRVDSRDLERGRVDDGMGR
jgi:hypothetical protein